MRDAMTSIAAAERHLAAVNPNAVLDRGYTLTRLEDGTLVRDPAQVDGGAKMRTTTAKGDVWSVASGEEAEKAQTPKPVLPQSPAASPQPAPAARKKKRGDDAPGLFA